MLSNSLDVPLPELEVPGGEGPTGLVLEEGRWCIRCYNEGGHNCTDVDAVAFARWLLTDLADGTPGQAARDAILAAAIPIPSDLERDGIIGG